jgi:hypothetical protein
MKWMERKHSVLLCDIILLCVSCETDLSKTSINARSITTALFECKIIRCQASTCKMIFIVCKTVTQNDFLFWYQPVTQFSDIDSVRLWVYEKKNYQKLHRFAVIDSQLEEMWCGQLDTRVFALISTERDQKSWPRKRKTGKTIKSSCIKYLVSVIIRYR